MSKFGLVLGAAMLMADGNIDATDALIRRLGSSVYVERQKAYKLLSQMNDPATKAKLRAAQNSPDPEISTRVRDLLFAERAAEEAHRTAERRKAAFLHVKNTVCMGVLPMIEFSGFAPEVVRHYSDKSSGERYQKYRNATEALFKDLIEQGYQVDDLARSMMRTEDQWVDFCNSAGQMMLPRTWDELRNKKK